MFDNNPFFNSMKNFMNPELFSNSVKNINNMDFSSFADFVKKSTENLNETNKKIAESMHSLARRGSEMFQENMAQGFNNLKNTMGATDMEQLAAKGQEYMKQAMETSVNQTKELIDMASTSSREIFESANNNASSSAAEAFNQNKQSV